MSECRASRWQRWMFLRLVRLIAKHVSAANLSRSQEAGRVNRQSAKSAKKGTNSNRLLTVKFCSFLIRHGVLGGLNLPMNFKLTIQYDGTDFHGWQMQGELRTVQGELTKALSLIDNRDVVVHGSGRTDAGVHAEGQVASVVLQREITPEKLRQAINGNVGKDVRVMEAQVAPDEFHARYSAVEKTYRYRIVNGPVQSPFWLRFTHHDARPLDLERMTSCGQLFLGTHDW